jgi:hypothetical protein
MTRVIICYMEEVPRTKAVNIIGDHYLYEGEEEIRKSRSQALTLALSNLGWNLTEPLHIESCKLGLSNRNYKISCGNYGPLLLRIFGPTVGESNPNERHIQDCGFGAQVVQRLGWGRLEAWLPGRPMRRKDCDNSSVLAVFANELRRLHSEADRNHNDLNFTNVLIFDNDESPTLHLLDFEYAGPLDPPFDVANFFCEWIYDYESPRWFEPDPTQFPTNAQARSFVALYLGISDCNNVEVSVFLNEVQERLAQVHIFWIDWALKNFSDSDDYIQYAEQRQILVRSNLTGF